MALRFGVISVDDHVVEPPDLWTACMSQGEMGRSHSASRAVQADGTERWVIDGQVKAGNSLAPTGALSKDRGAEPQAWSEVPEGAYEPQARLRAMDCGRHRLFGALSDRRPAVSGEDIGAIKDLDLQIECARVYNDWIIDVWAAASPRFVPQAILPIGSVEAAVAEAQRAVGRGHKGRIMPAQPSQTNSAVASSLQAGSGTRCGRRSRNSDVPDMLPRRQRAQRYFRDQPGLQRCHRGGIRQRPPVGRQRSAHQRHDAVGNSISISEIAAGISRQRYRLRAIRARSIGPSMGTATSGRKRGLHGTRRQRSSIANAT